LNVEEILILLFSICVNVLYLFLSFFLSVCSFGLEMRRPLLDFWVLPVRGYVMAFDKNCSANASKTAAFKQKY